MSPTPYRQWAVDEVHRLRREVATLTKDAAQTLDDAMATWAELFRKRARQPRPLPAIVCPRCGAITRILVVLPDGGRECLECRQERDWQ